MFFGYVNPTYRSHTDADGNPDSVVDLLSTVDGYALTLNNQTQLKNKVDDLTNRKNRISEEDLASLKKLLPASVDNVRLIIEIENIVKEYSPQGFKSVSINKAAEDVVVSEGEKYNSLSINFTVSMPYENFVRFLQKLESNLRLADVTSISFSANDIGNYDYTVSLKTYWLK